LLVRIILSSPLLGNVKNNVRPVLGYGRTYQERDEVGIVIVIRLLRRFEGICN